MQAGLGRRIVGLAEIAGLAADRTDVDHAPETARLHAVDRMPAEVEGTAQVHVYDFFPLRTLHLAQGGVAGDACIVDQDVECAVLRFDALHQCAAGIVIPHVRRGEMDVQAFDFLLESTDPFTAQIQVHRNHGASGLCECLADLRAQSANTTGNHGDALAHVGAAPGVFSKKSPHVGAG